ncbi:hypothetical protein DSO57_1004666 [Entomophthora muscae]|uniref:Uncharacterized protein n=1 Tax=Entomophthora muscae TaxID=34485 RepID=A0ACC2T7W3_9FUNG|nr:hypothetical protein DSO57_1004666 [Entomophthora muscae]
MGALCMSLSSRKHPSLSGLTLLPPAPSFQAHKLTLAILNARVNLKVCSLHLVSCSTPNSDHFTRPLRSDLLLWASSQGQSLHPLHFVEDLPSRVHNLLVSGECLVKNLTWDGLDPFLSNQIPKEPPGEDSLVLVPLLKNPSILTRLGCAPGLRPQPILATWRDGVDGIQLLLPTTISYLLLGHLFEGPLQGCAGWGPGGSFPRMGAKLVSLAPLSQTARVSFN